MAFWIFKHNPEKYRLNERLADPNPTITWTVRRFRDEIGPAILSFFGKQAKTVKFVRCYASMRLLVKWPSLRANRGIGSNLTENAFFATLRARRRPMCWPRRLLTTWRRRWSNSRRLRGSSRNSTVIQGRHYLGAIRHPQSPRFCLRAQSAAH